MSANNSNRAQKVSFSTPNSVLGVPSFTCGAPYIVIEPSLSVTTNCPTEMRLSKPRMMVLEKRIKGGRVKEPTYVRRVSSGWVNRAIGVQVGEGKCIESPGTFCPTDLEVLYAEQEAI